jgi:hypothetical protein
MKEDKNFGDTTLCYLTAQGTEQDDEKRIGHWTWTRCEEEREEWDLGMWHRMRYRMRSHSFFRDRDSSSVSHLWLRDSTSIKTWSLSLSLSCCIHSLIRSIFLRHHHHPLLLIIIIFLPFKSVSPSIASLTDFLPGSLAIAMWVGDVQAVLAHVVSKLMKQLHLLDVSHKENPFRQYSCPADAVKSSGALLLTWMRVQWIPDQRRDCEGRERGKNSTKLRISFRMTFKVGDRDSVMSHSLWLFIIFLDWRRDFTCLSRVSHVCLSSQGDWMYSSLFITDRSSFVFLFAWFAFSFVCAIDVETVFFDICPVSL